MRKLFLIAWKDLTLIFRDRSALVLMLMAPFLLTVGMGFITGRFSGSTSTGVTDIPLAIVNQDDGELGQALVNLFQSPDVDTLVETTLISDPLDARAQVDEDAFVAALVIPPGFTASIIPPEGANSPAKTVQIEFYANPTQPTNTGILRTILDQFISQVEVGRIGVQVAVTQLLQGGYITPDQAATVGNAVGAKQAQNATSSAIQVNNVTASGEPVKFDSLSYMAPGMALMFLMFTVTYGGRSLLTENRQGTLPRMLVSPTTSGQILGGKVFGIFLTGVAQLLILIGGTSLLFNLKWGDPLAVLLLVLAAAFGATGWGMIIAAFLKTPGQISSVGSAVMLMFGILGGSFVDISMLPDWVGTVSKITPNAWGLDGFITLAAGGTLKNILTPILALLIMGALLFAIASIGMHQRGLDRK
ncbi:MAG: ABC transporter permease [Anaerolineaceae bacterium]